MSNYLIHDNAYISLDFPCVLFALISYLYDNSTAKALFPLKKTECPAYIIRESTAEK